MTAHSIASKFRRALRNETGATFTNDQLRELGRLGVLRMLAEIEAQELCHEKPAPTDATPIGSTSAAMAVRNSGRSLGQAEGRSYIEALAR
ncbi:hypothetical protein UFOVP368_37 [uncultured Caudovirales phage]|uniref:Uncharacterized protein n=1 Tax=uncultured Caudovirales phage TaxID=2100421 RepID=A0A6J7WYM6_9CAUD|nr:hypothetical protein UFOVP368_37 [uncultured Caudovirales phage]